MKRLNLSVATVIEHAAFEFDCSVADVLGKSKSPRFAWCRHAISWLARRHTRATLREIGEAMGSRGVWTIIEQVHRADRLLVTDECFASLLSQVDGLLTGMCVVETCAMGLPPGSWNNPLEAM